MGFLVSVQVGSLASCSGTYPPVPQWPNCALSRVQDGESGAQSLCPLPVSRLIQAGSEGPTSL